MSTKYREVIAQRVSPRGGLSHVRQSCRNHVLASARRPISDKQTMPASEPRESSHALDGSQLRPIEQEFAVEWASGAKASGAKEVQMIWSCRELFESRCFVWRFAAAAWPALENFCAAGLCEDRSRMEPYATVSRRVNLPSPQHPELPD